jgi:hypothetical protein
MKTRTVIVLSAGTLALAGCAQTPKPVREEIVNVDYGPPPSGLVAMSAKAAAVVVAEYTGKARPLERVSKEGTPQPALRSTFYSFRILEILKSDREIAAVGSEMEFELPGGDKEFPTYIERMRDPDTRELEPGHKYVLFVNRNPIRKTLQLVWGPLGIYDITDGLVTSLRRDRHEYDGETAASFLALARSAGK